jgi:Ca2+:H+ antiporter
VESVQKAAQTFGMSPAFVGFIIVSIVGAAAEMAVAFSAARKNRLDMRVAIALGSASQIAPFVAPVLVLLSYVVGPAPMNLQFWAGRTSGGTGTRVTSPMPRLTPNGWRCRTLERPPFADATQAQSYDREQRERCYAP